MTRIHIAKFGQMCLKCFSLYVIYLIKRNAKTGMSNKTTRKRRLNQEMTVYALNNDPENFKL